jgi:hypothetical protein
MEPSYSYECWYYSSNWYVNDAGYLSGAAMLPLSVGGKGFNQGQAHEILAPFVEPISIAILVLILGVLLYPLNVQV